MFINFSIYVHASFSCGFEGGMLDVIVLFLITITFLICCRLYNLLKRFGLCQFLRLFHLLMVCTELQFELFFDCLEFIKAEGRS